MSSTFIISFKFVLTDNCIDDVLERFSISISSATILAVLAKAALLHHLDKEAGNDWLVVGQVDQEVVVYLLLTIFLVFFRGKMMHDDATFFSELEGDKNKQEEDKVFKHDNLSNFIIKLGLVFGYISWILWAPAIYFLDDPTRFSGFLIGSLTLSSFWLVIDILTRIRLEWRRAFWIIPNAFYIMVLSLMQFTSWSLLSAIGLLVVLLIDWLISDPLSGYI